MNSTYSDESNYVNSNPMFQDLQTYNDYSVNPPQNDIRLAIYPTFGGVGYPTLQHNLPRNEINNCDYFSLGNAYQSSTPCTQRCSAKLGYVTPKQ